MREVAVLGIGQTKVDEHWDKSLRELAGEAVLAALHDAGVQSADALFVGNMMSGSANHQQHLGAYIADWVGLRFREALHIEVGLRFGRGGLPQRADGGGLRRSGSGRGGGCRENDRLARATRSPPSWPPPPMPTGKPRPGPLLRRAQRPDHAPLHARIRLEDMTTLPPSPSTPTPTPSTTPLPASMNRSPRDDYEKSAMIADPINLLDASPMGDGAARPCWSRRAHRHAWRREIIRWPAPAPPPIRSPSTTAATRSGLRAAERSARQAYARPGSARRISTCFEAARRLHHHGGSLAGSLRFCRPRPGPSPGPGWRDPPHRAHSHRHAGRAESPRPSRSARPACTRSSRWSSSCAARPAEPRWRMRSRHGPEYRRQRIKHRRSHPQSRIATTQIGVEEAFFSPNWFTIGLAPQQAPVGLFQAASCFFEAFHHSRNHDDHSDQGNTHPIPRPNLPHRAGTALGLCGRSRRLDQRARLHLFLAGKGR